MILDCPALGHLGTFSGDTGLAIWINDSGDIVGKADLPGPAPQLHDAVLGETAS